MTTLDPITAGVIRDLAGKVHELDQRVRDQARASQARDRSVEGGAQSLYDENNELRAVIGEQSDGSFTITTYGGDAPDVPSPPLVAPFPGGATVTWDGYDQYDEQGWPADFARVTVHLTTIPDDPPPVDLEDYKAWLRESQVASFESSGGGAVGVTQPADVLTYCTLVAWSQAGVPSAQSIEVEVMGGGLPDTAPTEPPANSPAIEVTGLADSIVIRSETVAPSTLIQYHMREYDPDVPFVPVVDDPVTLYGIPTRSAVQIVNGLPGVESGLDPDKLYEFATIATNAVDPAAPSAPVTGKTDATALTAQILAELVVGIIMAGTITVGQITIDPDTGITIPQPDGGTIHFPADGKLAEITAYIVAKGLTMTGDASFYGLTQIFGNMKWAGGIVAPTSKPALSSSWQSVDAAPADVDWSNAHHGLTDNPAGTELLTVVALFGGGWLSMDPTTGDQIFAATLNPSTMNPVGGITRVGNYYYVCGYDTARGGDFYIYKYDLTFTKQAASTDVFLWPSGAVAKYPAIGHDGTNLLVAYCLATGDVRVRKYLIGATSMDSYRDIETNSSGVYDLAGVYEGAFDFGVQRLVVMTKNGPNYVSATALIGGATKLALVSGDNFVKAGSTQAVGLHWDATRFRHLDTNGKLWTYAASCPRAVDITAAHAWYDGDTDAAGTASGTPSDGIAYTHETQVGPTEIFQRKARTFLTLASSPPPEASVTDPTKTDKANRTRVYAYDSNSGGPLRLQASHAVGTNSITLEGLSTSGKTPETVNGFTGISAAATASSTGVRSDGTPSWELTGTGPGHVGPYSWDAAGVAPPNPHSRRYLSGTQAIPTGTVTQVTYGTNTETTGMTFTTGGTWTIDRAGLYELKCSQMWDGGTSGRRMAIIRLNGAEVARKEVWNPNATNNFTVDVSTKKRLAVGDTVTFHAYETGVASLNLLAGEAFSFAEVSFVGP